MELASGLLLYPLLINYIDDENFPIPIYVAFENEALIQIYKDLQLKEAQLTDAPLKCKTQA
jgi:hypothetical protein